MQYSLYHPPSPLNRFVECLWYVDGQVLYQRERILPTATIELIINFGSPHKVVDSNDAERFQLNHTSWVCGFQTNYIINEPIAETQMLGIRFKPGGAFPFLHLPIHELSNTIIDLDLVIGNLADDIRERALNAPTLPSIRLTFLLHRGGRCTASER